jgi:hypothetical protein
MQWRAYGSGSEFGTTMSLQKNLARSSMSSPMGYGYAARTLHRVLGPVDPVRGTNKTTHLARAAASFRPNARAALRQPCWTTSRNRLSEEVICGLLRDFRKHGEKAIAKVRRERPGVYLTVLGLLIPREHQVEHSNLLKNLTDEKLDPAIDLVKQMLESRAASEGTVIEGQAVEVTALPKPGVGPTAKLYAHADTAVGLTGASQDAQDRRRRSARMFPGASRVNGPATCPSHSRVANTDSVTSGMPRK